MKYEIINHGFEQPDYFQGCGSSFTGYDECVTGCGFSETDAWYDALDQIAYQDNVESLLKALDDEKAAFGDLCEDISEDDAMYYISVRYSL